ncbi:MAG TPA: helix-hairpin-helix domain-containing protein [Bryobacteraceae bacterium]
MYQVLKLLVFPGVAVGLFFAPGAAAQSAQSLPEGKGKAQFTRACGQCHGVDLVIKQNNTADGWAAIVDDMVSRGAQGSDDDFELVVKYLTAHFGPKVNLNKADAKRIASVLEIPETDAEAIVHYRETAGAFKDWRDLEKVPHIDIKKLEQEKDRIDFGQDPPPGEKK